jgi:hypothetical protein
MCRKGELLMELLEIAAAFTLSLVFIFSLWALKGFLLRPAVRWKENQVTVVVRADGETEAMDHVLAGLCRLRGDGRLRADIVVVDEGMDALAEASVAALLRREASFSVCGPESLANHILRGTADGAEGKLHADTRNSQDGSIPK